MPPVLTDEQMSPAVTPRQPSPVPHAPILSDHDMGVATSPGILSDHEMGITAPPVLTDAQMSSPSPMPPAPSAPSPIAPPGTVIGKSTIPKSWAAEGIPTGPRAIPVNPAERSKLDVNVGGDYRHQEQNIIDKTAVDNSLIQNVGGAIAGSMATAGQHIIGTVAPETATDLRQNTVLPVDPNSKAAGTAGFLTDLGLHAPEFLLGPAAAAIGGGIEGTGESRIQSELRRRHGEDVSGLDEAKRAIGHGIIDAVTNAVLAKLLPGGAGGGVKGFVTRSVERALVGGGTGAAHQAASNVIEDRPILEGTGGAALHDAAFQTGFGAIHEGIGAYYRGRSERARTPEDRARAEQEFRQTQEDVNRARQARQPESGEPPPGQARQPGTEPPPGQQQDQQRQQNQQDQQRQRRQARPPRQAPMTEAEARAELGLPPNGEVDADTVSRAFRARVVRTHPDAGGSEEAVMRTIRAREVMDGVVERSPRQPPPGQPEQPGAEAEPPRPQPAQKPQAAPSQANPQPTPGQPAGPVEPSPEAAEHARPMTDAEMGVSAAKPPQPAAEAPERVVAPEPTSGAPRPPNVPPERTGVDVPTQKTVKGTHPEAPVAEPVQTPANSRTEPQAKSGETRSTEPRGALTDEQMGITSPPLVEGQYAIPGTEPAVRAQEQVERFAGTLRQEYPELRNDRPAATALSKTLHDTVDGWMREFGDVPKTEQDYYALMDAVAKRVPAGEFPDDRLPTISALKQIVQNLASRAQTSGTIKTERSDERSSKNEGIDAPAVQQAGPPETRGVGSHGARPLAGQPARTGEGIAESGAAVGGAGTGGGRREGAIRADGGRGDRSASGEGDRPEGVHPDRPAGTPDTGGDRGGPGESDRGVPELAGEQREAPKEPAAKSPSNAGNFVISDPATLHAGGLKQKFSNNVNAIETLRKIEAEGRSATPEEQAILARYVGWGAMPGAFNKYSEDAGTWTAERDEIAGLLTPEEFDAAAKSTLNAHFTSGPVVQGMWEIAKRLGFTGQGRILEPSMGVGNFFGLLPPEFRGASLTGVELDKLTGRIARQLYPKANVLVQGFEDLKTPNGFFDLAISNVPFGDFRVHDPAYNKFRAPIHDYFFLKSVDQVHPGGVVMYITSTGTLDKADARIRKELAAKADLVAAIRLPEGAFAKNAGTAVVTDLIILKRRADNTPASGPAWTQIKTVPDPEGGEAIPINEYFAEHPEQVLGTVDRKSRLYGKGQPHVSMGDDFEQRWKDAIQRVPEGAYEPREGPERISKPGIIAPDTVKEGGFVKQGSVLRRRDKGELVDVQLTPKEQKIVEGMLGIRDALRNVINAQIQGQPQASVDRQRKLLNAAYDEFVKKYGPLHKPENRKAFDRDPDSPVLLALEHWNKKTKTATKSDAFSKNTVRGFERPTKAQNPAEAIGISLNETARVDIDRIASLLGKSPAEVEKSLVSEGLAYLDPSEGWQSAEQYLSGNVRRKLLEAKQSALLDPKFKPNVEALEKVQPADVPYDEIDARLGVPWVGPEDIAQFAGDQFGSDAGAFAIKYLPSSGEWLADWSSTGNRLRGTPNDTQILGTSRAGFADVLEAALNNKIITIRDKIDKDTYVVNKEESAAANQKVDDLQQRFRDWIWQEDARRHRLHRYYNDTFNNIAPVRYNGSHLKFPGMSPTYNGSPLVIRDHQRNAIWRTIAKGTALYAHEVGTGKTITMVASAMELRRLGLSRKPAIAVLKSTLPGFVREARELYPTAKILVVDKFDAQNRKQIVSRIATGDWDVVILTHDHVDMLPMKKETQSAFIQKELDELESVISDVKEAEGPRRGRKSDNRLVKKLEKAKARLEERLKEALDSKQDDAITFEETGIDQLFVDEAHKYKSLPVYTKQDRIKGIPTSRSDRATQMWMRTRWLQQMNNGRGVVMATGTPITNTMAELYTMMRYLQGRDLEERGIAAFDAWARNFGIITTRMEYGVTGEYSPVSRFSKFVNLPELGRIAGQVIDVQRAKNMPNLKRPKRKDQVVTVPMSAAQAAYLQEIKQRAIAAKKKRPGEKGDNMLSISTDARKSALDMRLVDRGADALDSAKVAKVVNNVLDIWREDPTRTQMIFSDIGIHPTQWGYSPFNEITERLIEGGIPPEKIINFSTLTDVQKRDASKRLKEGSALIGLGSTDKMGTGVNAQDHLYALHHMDVPWLPGSVEQRDGRGWRQGNRHKQVQILRYTTEGSFDTFMWQAVDAKTRFIQQFVDSMASGTPTERSVQDEDTEELSPAQIMAVTSGNPLLLDKINLDRDVSDLEGASRRHERNTLRLKDTAVNLDQRVRDVQEDISALETDLKTVEAAPDVSGENFQMKVGDTTYARRDEAAQPLLEVPLRSDWRQIGEFRGLPLYARRAPGSDPEARLGSSILAKLSPLSIEYASRPTTIKADIQRAQQRMTQFQKDAQAAREESTRPYPKSEELKQKKSELAKVIEKMMAQAKPAESTPSAEELDAESRSSRYHGAAYVGWLDPVVEIGQTVAGAAKEVGEGFINLAVRDMIERTAARSTPSAKYAASLAEKAVNSAKAAAGTIVRQRDRALVVTGAGLSLARHKAQMSLQRVVYAAGKQYGIARIVDAVEGRIPAAQLTRAEQEAVDVIRELTDATGNGYRANGVQQYNYTTGQWQPFNYIPGGKVFVRLHTPEMMDAIAKGKGPVWDAAIDAIDDLNPRLGRQTVEKIMQAKHAEMIGEGAQGAFGRVNAEFTREIPKMPTHVMVDGQEIPLIDTNPFNYARRLSDHYAARVGFVKWFGQDTGPQSPLSMLRELYLKENGEAKTLVELTRALNGISVTDPILEPGGKMARILRWTRDLMTIAKAGMLSASTVQNLAEPLGNLQTFSEGADYFKAAWNLLRSPRATIAALEQLGAVNMNPADLAWNPNRPTESVGRIIREASGRIFAHQFVNELQEKMAGAIALEKAQRMQAGKGTAGDVVDLRALGFPLDKARRLAAGKGTPAEYNEVVRRMPTALVGSPMGGAEKTRLSHNRVYRAAIAFESYAQMKVRSFVRQAAAYADIARKTRMGRDDPKLFFAAHVKFARYLAGTTASGALAYFLMALATGGMLGLDIALHEAKDRPLRFLRDSFLYTLLAGPYGAIMRTATGDRGLGETLVRGTLPGFLIAEIIDAVQGNGSYGGMTPLERMSHVAGRLVPVNRIATQAAAAMGFGADDARMDTAVRAYWRWKLDDSPGKFTAAEVEADRAKFRDSMKRAYARMRAGDTAGMTQSMAEAVKARPGMESDDTRKAMAQSILSRRLLWNLPDEKLEALRSRIGEAGMSQLQAHDNLLLAWASSLGTPNEAESAKAIAGKDVRGAAALNDEEMTSRALRSEKTPERQDAILHSAGIEIPADVPMARELTELRRMKRDEQITPRDNTRLSRLEGINRSIRAVREQMKAGTVDKALGQRRIDNLLKLATTLPAA